MLLIDAHCHLDDPRFDGDREEVVARARRQGVIAQVLPAVARREWPRLRAVVAAFPGLYPSYGLHPLFLSEHRPEDLEELAGWLEQEPAVAVGECGLDFSSAGGDADTQIDYLTAQLRLARDFDLPVILHARKAVDSVTKYLRRFPGLRGMVHSFAGSQQQADTLMQQGFFISVGGPLTFPRAQRLRSVVSRIPLEGLLVETDAPDQPGAGHRGERNEPAYARGVIDPLAELRAESAETIARTTAENTRRLFRLPTALTATGEARFPEPAR